MRGYWWLTRARAGTSPILSNYAPRSVSPFSAPPAVPPKPLATERRDRDTQIPRKKPPSLPNSAAAVGILKSLDPLTPDVHPLQREYSDDHSLSNEHSSREEARDGKKERKGFWERAKERDREREKERERTREKERKEEEGQAELTRMIGAYFVRSWGIRQFSAACQVTLLRVRQKIGHSSSSCASAHQPVKPMRRKR